MNGCHFLSNFTSKWMALLSDGSEDVHLAENPEETCSVKDIPITTSEMDQQMKICFEQIQKIRSKTGVLQRFSILCQIYPKLANGKNQNYEFNYLLQQNPDLSSDCILPQHVQFISKLYEFITYSPDDLTKIVINANNIFSKEDFVIFTWSVLPSLFGYFTFAEHCYLAYQFFTVFTTSTHSKLLSREILTPFFRCPATYLFHESIFRDVIAFFCNDARLSARNFSKYEQEYAQLFFNSFINHMSKLPVSHFNLIRFMRKINWSSKEIRQFLIEDCCIPMISTLLKASPFSYTLPMFEAFVKLIPPDFDQKLDLNIFKVQSVYEIPSGFFGFNHSYIEFIASPNDATMLVKASNVIKLPKLISMIMSPKYTESTLTVPIWFKIFPKRIFQVDSRNLRNVIFPSSELVETKVQNIPIFDRWWRRLESEASDSNTSVLKLLYENPYKNYLKEEDSGMKFEDYIQIHELNSMKARAIRFEQFLALELSLKSVKKYNHQVKDFSNCEIFMISRNIFTDLFNSIKKPKVIVHFNYDNFLSLFSVSYQSAQFAYALKYQNYIETLNKSYRTRANNIEKMWLKMLESVEYNKLPKCLQVTPQTKALIINKAYISASSSLNVISQIPFSMQFFVIIECLKHLEIVSGNDDKNFVELVIHAIRSCISPGIIVSLLFLSGALMNRQDFLAVTPKYELTLWYTLMEGLHNFIGSNSELERSFYQLHDDVNMLFSDL